MTYDINTIIVHVSNRVITNDVHEYSEFFPYVRVAGPHLRLLRLDISCDTSITSCDIIYFSPKPHTRQVTDCVSVTRCHRHRIFLYNTFSVYSRRPYRQYSVLVVNLSGFHTVPCTSTHLCRQPRRGTSTIP